MQVRLFEYTNGAARTMAVFTVRDGKVAMQGTVPPQIEATLAELSQQEPVPEKFLRQLPREFRGTYLWAELTA